MVVPDHAGIRRQRARPEAVAEHDDAIGADDASSAVNVRPSAAWLLRTVKRSGVAFSAGTFCGSPVPLKEKSTCRYAASDSKRLRLALPVFERRNRDRPLVAVGIDLPQHRDLLGRFVRQRVEDDRLDDAEDRRVGADAQRQRQHRDQREGRLPTERAEGVFEGGGPVGHGGGLYRACTLMRRVRAARPIITFDKPLSLRRLPHFAGHRALSVADGHQLARLRPETERRVEPALHGRFGNASRPTRAPMAAGFRSSPPT